MYVFLCVHVTSYSTLDFMWRRRYWGCCVRSYILLYNMLPILNTSYVRIYSGSSLTSCKHVRNNFPPLCRNICSHQICTHTHIPAIVGDDDMRLEARGFMVHGSREIYIKSKSSHIWILKVGKYIHKYGVQKGKSSEYTYITQYT